MADPRACPIPRLYYTTRGMSDEQAFSHWRDLVAPMFDVVPAPESPTMPRGGMACAFLGDIIASRMTLNSQLVTRDAWRAEHTPDHLLLMSYTAGGFSGDVAGSPARVVRGRTVVVDLRTELDARVTNADMIGLSIPHALLPDLDRDRLPTLLDARRDRLLAARIGMVHRELALGSPIDPPTVVRGLTGFLHRLFEPSGACDLLEGPEFDASLAVMARGAALPDLGSPNLSPDVIAARLKVSRATLYRAFSADGGVMRMVWDLRLDAVRAALADPIETRSVARIAESLGFSSPAHLSRGFRARFGSSPRTWRQRELEHHDAAVEAKPSAVIGRWMSLGR